MASQLGRRTRGVETIVVANPNEGDLVPALAQLDPQDGCTADLVDNLLAGSLPSPSSGATTSPEQLALISPRIVRGQITGAQRTPHGSYLFFEVEEGLLLGATGPDGRPALWTQGFPAEDVQGHFVAFLTGDAMQPGNAGELAMQTHPDGLWVACDDKSPARSLHSMPSGTGWVRALENGLSLDQLWDLDAATVQGFEHDITSVGVLNQASVFDVQLFTGERFRLAVPLDRGTQLTVTERRAPQPISISNDLVDMTLTFDRCPLANDAILAPTGASLQRIGDGLRVCRNTERLRLDVAALPEPLASSRQWDVLAMQLGSRHGPATDSLWNRPGCTGCMPFGPMVIGRERPEVIVSRPTSSSIQGFSADDLSFLWRADFDNSIVMHPFLDLIIADILPGPIAALDAATGEERWRMPQDPSEGDLRVYAHRNGVTLMSSSFAQSPNDGPPVLRKIQANTGEILWEAQGDEQREWGASRPVIMEKVVVIFDQAVAVDTPAESPTLYGFDLATGDPLWSLTLNGNGAPHQYLAALHWVEVESGRVLIFDSDRGDLTRIDPADGSLIWRVTVGDVAVTGTEFAGDGTLAIVMSNSILIDPGSGAAALIEPPQECSALVGPNPWITLFDGRNAGCVIAADFQQIRIFNKGNRETTVSWVDGERVLGVDEFFDSAPVGEVLAPGLNSLASTPFVMDQIWRMPSAISPTARYLVSDEQLGPITVGMTVAQASQVLNTELIVDEQLFGCPAARVVRDPYSPLFLISDDDPATAVIERIVAGDNSSLAHSPIC